MVNEYLRQFTRDFVRNKEYKLSEEDLLDNGLYSDNDCLECIDEGLDLDELLNEVGTSTVRVTRKKKLKMLSGLSSVRVAKKKDDPLYKKYKRYREMALKAKRKLMKKYSSRGKSIARKALRR